MPKSKASEVKIEGFSPKIAVEILKHHVTRIEFHDRYLALGAMGSSGMDLRFVVFLREDPDEYEQKKTLIHELIHIFCTLRLLGGVKECDVEAEMNKFCDSHPQFCDFVYSRIRKNLESHGGSVQICRTNRQMFAKDRRQIRFKFGKPLFIT